MTPAWVLLADVPAVPAPSASVPDAGVVVAPAAPAPLPPAAPPAPRSPPAPAPAPPPSPSPSRATAPVLPPETTTPVLATWTPARGPVLDPRTAWKRQRRFKFELALGGFYNWIHAAQAYGGDGLVAMGSSNNRTTWDFNFQYSLGTTLHGLEVRKWRAGFTWDWIFDRFRFGIRQCFGGIELDRATTDGEIGTFFIGLDAHTSYDVIKFSEFSALFLAAAVKVDGGAWGPVIQLGFRGDVLTKPLPEVRPKAGASSSTPHRVPPAPAWPKR